MVIVEAYVHVNLNSIIWYQSLLLCSLFFWKEDVRRSWARIELLGHSCSIWLRCIPFRSSIWAFFVRLLSWNVLFSTWSSIFEIFFIRFTLLFWSNSIFHIIFSANHIIFRMLNRFLILLSRRLIILDGINILLRPLNHAFVYVLLNCGSFELFVAYKAFGVHFALNWCFNGH